MSHLKERKTKIFPKIVDTVDIEDEEEIGVVEIESLCMKCHNKQVLL